MAEKNFKERLAEAEDAYRKVIEVLPSGRERTQVLTKLDEARHWALELASKPAGVLSVG